MTAITAGSGHHSLALTDDGEVIAWGSDWAGQLDVPESVDGKNISALSAGYASSLALVDPGPLSTSVTADPATVAVGETAAVTVNAANPNIDAQELRALAVTVPEGFEYVDESSDAPETALSGDGRTLTFSGFDPLTADGGELAVSFKLKAVAAGRGAVEVSGTTVSGVEVTPSRAELSASETLPSPTPTPSLSSPADGDGSGGGNGETLPQSGASGGFVAGLAAIAALLLAAGNGLTVVRRRG